MAEERQGNRGRGKPRREWDRHPHDDEDELGYNEADARYPYGGWSYGRNRKASERPYADYGPFGGSQTGPGGGDWAPGEERVSGPRSYGTDWQPDHGGPTNPDYRHTARAREGPHRGRGPRGYVRSDDRIREDVCDLLCDDSHLDAGDIEVEVASGEVTLNGTVESRAAKRRAEDLAENVAGVQHCQNNLRVRRGDETHVTLSVGAGPGSGRT